MKWLIRFVCVFAIAVAVSLIARYSDAYALLVYPPYRVEISLPVLLFGLLGVFFALYALLRALTHTVGLPRYVGAYRRRRRDTRGQAALRNAWASYLEGHYARAQKFASRAYALHSAPALAALLAARSSHALRDFDKRDEWLQQAAKAPGASRSARLSVHAEMLLDEHRYEEARELLRELHEREPRQVATLRLLVRAEQGMGHWEEVLRLLRILDKRDPRSRPLNKEVRTTALVENLKQNAKDVDALRECWKRLRAEERTEPRVVATAARLYVELGHCKEALRLVTEALNTQWSPELILFYGECIDENDVLQRIQRCEAWLKQQPQDAALLLTLGRLCAQKELWGKAQSYFEASLAQQPTRATHRELARLYEKIGREGDADRHYRIAADEALPT